MALLLWTAWLLQVADEQTPVIREPDLSLEIPLPKGYRIADPGEQRYQRSVGPESWAIVSFKYKLNKDPLPPNPAGPRQEDVLERAMIARDSMISFSTVSWGEFSIGVVEYRVPVKSIDVVGMAAVIPIDRKAVVLSIETPVTFQNEMKQDFNWLVSRAKGPSNWPTLRQRTREGWARACGWTAGGLFVLYLLIWLLFFRGDVLRAHLLRTVWLSLIGVLLFIPLTLAPDLDIYGTFLYLFAPLVLFSFVGRRIKLAIDLG